MKIKVIAIGNTLMEDDGIGIVILQKLREALIKNNIEVIIGETDFQYCISLIEDGDFIFIIDAVYYNKSPGELTVRSIDEYTYKKKYYSQHSCNIVDLIKLYYKNIRGYIIGIEIGKISFKFGLSKELEDNINIISKSVLKEILLRLTSKIWEEK